jgi:hypothetical protein
VNADGRRLEIALRIIAPNYHYIIASNNELGGTVILVHHQGTSEVFRACWHFMKDDFLAMVLEFWEEGRLDARYWRTSP